MKFLKALSSPFLPSQQVFLYHAVTPKGAYPLLDRNADAVEPADFERQLRWISRFYDFASLDDVIGAIKAGSKERIAAITFDDGYRCVADYAVPILSDRGIPATIFLISQVLQGLPFWRDVVRLIISEGEEQAFAKHLRSRGFQSPPASSSLYRWSKSHEPGDSNRFAEATLAFLGAHDALHNLESLYLRPTDVRRLAQGGVHFGNHTRGHHVLATLSGSNQREEIAEADRVLTETVEVNKEVLSLPFGGSSDWNSDTLRMAAELGYSTVLSTIIGRPRTLLHSLNRGEILEIRRAVGSANVRGMLRSMSGR